LVDPPQLNFISQMTALSSGLPYWKLIVEFVENGPKGVLELYVELSARHLLQKASP
jgi:hypothetical protein